MSTTWYDGLLCFNLLKIVVTETDEIMIFCNGGLGNHMYLYLHISQQPKPN